MNFILKIDMKRHKIIKIVLAIVIFLVNGIYLKINYLTNYDEFTSLAMIAKLGGKDWSSLVAISDFHGYGHLLPIALIFQFINSGTIFYKCCMIWMLFLRIVMAEVIYILTEKCWKVDYRWSFFISIVCSLGTLAAEHQSPISVLTEVPLCFCTLIIVLTVWAGIEFNRNYFLFATFIAAFSMTIHARSVIIQIALFLSLIVLLCLDKKFKKKIDKKSMVFVIASFFIFYFFIRFVNKGLVNYLYISNETLSNSYETVVSLRVPYLFHVLVHSDQLKIAIDIFFANIVSYVFYSFGLIGIIFTIQMKYLFFILKRGYSNVEEKVLTWAVLFGTLCWIGMCTVIAFTSVGAIQEGNYAWYTYIRYSLPFVCIMVSTSMVIVCKKIVKIRVGWIFFIEVLACKYFVLNIAAKLDQSGYGMKYSMFNSLFYPNLGTNATVYFSKFTMIIIMVCIVYYWISYKEKFYFIFAIYLILSALIYIEVYKYHMERDIYSEAMCNKSVELINELKADNNPCTIYVSGGIGYILWLQAAVPDISLQYVEDARKEKFENSVLLTNDVTNYEDLDFIVLDNNEYVIMYD